MQRRKNPKGRVPLTEEVPGRVCYSCGATDLVAVLEVCRLCFRHFCADCAHKSTWGRFCSETCARSFYYGDEEDWDSDEHLE